MTEFLMLHLPDVVVAARSRLHPVHDLSGLPASNLGERLVGSLVPLTTAHLGQGVQP